MTTPTRTTTIALNPDILAEARRNRRDAGDRYRELAGIDGAALERTGREIETLYEETLQRVQADLRGAGSAAREAHDAELDQTHQLHRQRFNHFVHNPPDGPSPCSCFPVLTDRGVGIDTDKVCDGQCIELRPNPEPGNNLARPRVEVRSPGLDDTNTAE